ncbi:hypothetical protein JL108_09735 [Aeromicrobium sp. YIM 150415]|uniref:Uncharacterized protein n=1 Tax=Aeromicrobium piscarium TaxID=2590901 RepID=A0A554SDJ8_9ACTN|nr:MULTISPECIES: hypothetical protein [Aeromicrobium]MBM9463730.1 hypothetical protein [Aeromicrobium sp. YIM 150415]TSD64415.1 hypothetical protein FNM00_07730 [Aeromicrobium piscarium]
MGKRKKAKALRAQVEELAGHLPDREEFADLRDQVVDRLPDKKELVSLRDQLIDRLPDDVSDRLPVETKKKKRFKAVRRLAVVGLVAAGIGGVVAYLKAKADDAQVPPYTPPPSPTDPPKPAV